MNIRLLHSTIVALTAVIAAAFAPGASALPLDTYKETSLLASGKWVKISIPESGLYAIPASTLRSWGFSNIQNVRIYGYGAYRTNDILNATNFLDDLLPVQAKIDGQRIVFYGVGPMKWTSPITGKYVAEQNLFSNAGYYFVTESDEAAPGIPSSGRPEAENPATTFTERLQHEQELVSPGESGGFLVGEDFRYTPARTFSFDTPGLVDNSELWIECSFVAHTITANSRITLSVNGKQVESNASDIINSTNNDSHYHGTNGTARHTVSGVSGNRQNIELKYSASSPVYGAWLDYLTINYTRSLSLSGGHLCFAGGASALKLDNASQQQTTLWDVTNPRSISAIDFGNDGEAICWTSSYGPYREYAAWNSSAKLPAPAFVANVSNQNLHGLETADMVIITPHIWKAPCERIANIHRNEGLKVNIVDVEQVYNEFGSGCPDIHALRRFLKMLYDRGNQEGGTPLRYVLLMGRGTVDNRHVTALLQNSAPTIPFWVGGTLRQSLNDSEGFTTDDFLAMLDDNTGNNKGWDNLSVAVGRIPVSSLSQANSYVDKLEGYVNKPKNSPWKNQILVLADDDDNAIHMSQSDIFTSQMATDPDQQYLDNKVYIDAYERSGGVYPEARSQMFRLLNEGTMMWVYIGHANNHSLTADGMVTFNDLNNMYLKHLPVMYAATCDFLRWDSSVTSGGELLMHERYGGVIAAISATRPVFIYDNGLFSAAIARQMAAREADGRYGTIGDIYRRAKNNILAQDKFGNYTEKVSNPNRLRYVLMGDPAMRLVMPDNIVRLDAIEDRSCGGNDLPNVQARQTARFYGSVTSPDGKVLEDFNGSLTATIFDAEQSTTTKGHGDKGTPYTFQHMGGKLFAGSTPIVDGRFELKVTIPAEIADNYRPATINMYAQAADSSAHKDAIGVSHNFYISGMADVAEPDTIPPSIDSFYLNHPSFVDGGIVNVTPMVMASVSDNLAINLSNSGIGHNMRLTVDTNRHFNDVASYYTPAPDGSAAGTINYPLTQLSEGPHELTLRVWDVAGNQASKTIAFNVDPTNAPKIFDVFSDANPATTQANFFLSHDRPDQMLNVTVHVYNLLGAPLWSKSVTGVSDLFLSTPVTWDLCDDSGKRVPRGIYLYKAEITENGVDYSTQAHRIAVGDY